MTNESTAQAAGRPRDELLAGAGLGLLVGLLLGLSVSEVVGAALSALVALLAAFFGLQPKAADAPALSGRTWRVAGFGIVCAVALLAGIAIRANGLLGESVSERMATWMQAGYSTEEARALVAYQELGIAPKDWTTIDAERVTRRASSALFGDETASACPQLAARRFADPDERHRAFQRAGDGWAWLAAAVADLEAPGRNAAIEAAWRLRCEP